MAGFASRVRIAYNVLTKKDLLLDIDDVISVSSGARQQSFWRDSASAVLAPIKTKIAIAAAAVPIYHVLLDEDGLYKETKRSELTNRLRLKANIDQTGTAFIQDAVETMLEDGAVACVPVEVTSDPHNTSSYDILSLRVGKIVEWYNRSIKVSIYNEISGQREDIVVPKSYAAISYNPFYSIMNEPNSTLKRLIDKLALLDISDNKTYSPSLDIILQIPYSVRHETRQKEVKKRIELLEEQLFNSTYGVAYIDGTEKITQLNRPVSNSLADHIQKLKEELYNQLGLTASVFNGTASDAEMLIYHNSTIAPILSSITEAMVNAFLTPTAIQQGHSIRSFPSLFKMAPLTVMADAADSFTRNEIMSSDEVRGFLGLKPEGTPESRSLRNKNLNKTEQPESPDDKSNSSDTESDDTSDGVAQ